MIGTENFSSQKYWYKYKSVVIYTIYFGIIIKKKIEKKSVQKKFLIFFHSAKKQ